MSGTGLSRDHNFPLSLQDYCKLNVLLYIDQYPVDLLSKLPTGIRRKLFLALPLCDRLHFWDTDFLNDLDLLTSPFDTTCSEKDKLVGSLFTDGKLISFLTLNVHEAFETFDCLSQSQERSFGQFIEHVSSLGLTGLRVLRVEGGYCKHSSGKVPITCFSDNSSNNVFMPSRYFQFFKAQNKFQSLEYDVLDLFDLRGFVTYCRVLKGPKHLKIDTVEFLQSPLWQKYEQIREEAFSEARQRRGLPHDAFVEPVISPPIIPYLESIFSSVEHLEIGSTENIEFAHYNLTDAFIDAPYFVMCNIASNRSACLKSIETYGLSEGAVQVLQTVAGFLCGKHYNNMAHYHLSDNLEYFLTPPLDDPLLIEALTVKAFDGFCGYVREFVTEDDANAISNVMKLVFDVQMKNLKNVNVLGIGVVFESLRYGSPEQRLDSYIDIVGGRPSFLTTDAYISLLTGTFVEFIKQPQFQSLVLGDSPEQYCYDIIACFLITPASSDQELSISVTGKGTVPHHVPPFPSKFPATNSQFKSLCLGSNDCQLSKQIVSLSKVEWKKLQIPVTILRHVKSDAKINVSHIRLTVDVSHTDGASDHFLRKSFDSFFGNNSSLTIIEFIFDENPFFFSNINYALKKILTKSVCCTVLKEIRIQNVNFRDYHVDEHTVEETLGELDSYNELPGTGYNFSRYSATVDLSFFSSLQSKSLMKSVELAEESTCMYYYNKDIFDFFVLVQMLGVTLFLSVNHLFFDHKKNLIPALKTRFGKKKIKEIVISSGQEELCELETDCILDLKQIAEMVVVNTE